LFPKSGAQNNPGGDCSVQLSYGDSLLAVYQAGTDSDYKKSRITGWGVGCAMGSNRWPRICSEKKGMIVLGMRGAVYGLATKRISVCAWKRSCFC